MNRLNTLGLTLGLLLLLWAVFGHADTRKQTATARWDSVCILSVQKTEDTYLTAPLDSQGEPDMTRVVAHGVSIKVQKNCMRYEITR